MASTYSALKIELIATGEQSGTWGATTNVNLGDAALGEAITGSADVAFTGADVTITLTDTNTTQAARNLRLNLTGTSGGARNLILGSGCQIEKLYLVNNGLADAVTIKNTTGTGIAIPAGKSAFVFNNGTNVVEAVNYAGSISTGAITATSITNSGLTSGRVVYSTTGGLETDSANLLFNGTTLTANTIGAYTLGGTIAGGGNQLNNIIIGTSTPLAGSFTTINASTSITNAGLTSGRVTYAGASGLLTDSSALTYNGTALTASASSAISGVFNRLTSSGATLQIQVVGTSIGTLGSDTGGNSVFDIAAVNSMFLRATGASSRIVFSTNNAEAMTLDTSGNLGLGVTPSAWRSTDRAFEIGSVGKSLMAPASGNSIYLATNWYVSTTPANLYVGNGYATRYAQSDGVHTWWNAPNNTSGAGAALTFTQAMTLDASGNLGIGVTDPASYSAKLNVAGNISASAGNNIRVWDSANTTYVQMNSPSSRTIRWANDATTEYMRIDSSGNLGIGTSSPSYKLSVTNAASGYIASFTNTTSADLLINLTAGVSLISPSTGILALGTSNTERFRIDSGGRFGFGAPTAADRLVDMSFVNSTTTGSNQFGIVLNPTYPNTVTSTLFNVYLGPNVASGATFTTLYNLYLEASGTTGSTVTNKYALYQQGTNDKNYFAGNVGVATTVPQGRVNIVCIGSTLGLTGDAGLRIQPSGTGSTDQIVFGYSEAGGYSSGVIGYVATNTGGFQYGALIFATRNVNTNTAPTERVRIDPDGDVLIGTTSSTTWNGGTTKRILAVANANSGDANSIVTLKSNASTVDHGGIFEAYSTAVTSGSAALGSIGFVRGNTSNTALSSVTTFFTNTAGTVSEKMRIDTSGNLLVNTTTTGAYFDGKITSYSPDTYAPYCGKQGQSAASVNVAWNAGTTGDNVFEYFLTETSPTIRGSITYNRAGGLVAYNVTSDYRAKDIIGPVTDSGALIDSVPVYMGKMKDATQERPMFIAHETPVYAHTGVKDAVDKDGKPVYQQMDASSLIPVMWAEIQSLRQRIATLENK